MNKMQTKFPVCSGIINKNNIWQPAVELQILAFNLQNLIYGNFIVRKTIKN